MLGNAIYCPALYARVAEIKALRELPAASKDVMLPIISARPWPNAKHLTTTWDRIVEAMGQRRFAIDLDHLKYRIDNDRPAGAEFDSLFESEGGFERYYDVVEEIASAVPVVRLVGGEALELADQATHIETIDRGAILRIQYGSTQNPIRLAEEVLDALSDVAVVIDVGWAVDLLSREIWASQLIERIANVAPETEIVICGSSFPESFTNVGERRGNPVNERFLYSNLVRRHNAATLIYGDWGSTRPPRPSSPMKNVRRLDLPLSNEWVSFRSVEDETYAEIADRMMTDGSWPANLNIWGTYAISCTAQNLPGSIRSPGTAAAVRINIHMHRQANFNTPGAVNDSEEPYVD